MLIFISLQSHFRNGLLSSWSGRAQRSSTRLRVLDHARDFMRFQACCDRIRRAMLLPPSDSSPFFQPGAKARSSRVDVPHKATTATEVGANLL